jgi:hypothetical protein
MVSFIVRKHSYFGNCSCLDDTAGCLSLCEGAYKMGMRVWSLSFNFELLFSLLKSGYFVKIFLKRVR